MYVKLQVEILFNFDSVIQQFKYKFKCVIKVLWKTLSLDQTYTSSFLFFFSSLSNSFYLQLPADLTKMHLTDNPHPQVTHVPSSQSGCSIASDSGSSSLSDIYQVRLLCFHSFPSLMLKLFHKQEVWPFIQNFG